MEEQTVLTSEKLQGVLNEYRDRLLEALPGQIERIILFGSYARGDARPESDVDVVVVVNWRQEQRPDGFYTSEYTNPRWQKIIGVATDMMLKHSVFTSPKVFSIERFEQSNESLIKAARKEGVELWRRKSTPLTPG